MTPGLGTEDGSLHPLLAAMACPHPPAKDLLAWWQGLPRQARWPDWAAVDRRDLKPWMGWLVLYDVVDGGSDYRYRLVGSEIADRAGIDLTGRMVSEACYSSDRPRFRKQLDRLQEMGEPVWIAQPIQTCRGYSVVHDRLCLPFARGGEELTLWLFFVCRDELVVDRYHQR